MNHPSELERTSAAIAEYTERRNLDAELRQMERREIPRKLTRKEMESRRFEAAGYFEKGYSQAKIAEIFGISRMGASRWWKRWQAGQLERKVASGRPSRLSAEQLQELAAIYRAGPVRNGLRYWTHPAIRVLIFHKWGIEYHPDHIGRILHALNLHNFRAPAGRPRKVPNAQ